VNSCEKTWRAEAHLILLIEDEPAIADAVVYALQTEGFETRWVTAGSEGLAVFAEMAPELVILDVGLPDMSGFDVCRRIRARSDTPVIFLTARAAEIDCVVGLEIGGDDYMVKPFSPRELTARVRARLRARRRAERSARKARSDSQHPVHNAGFEINRARQAIYLHGQDLELSRYEFRLLSLLLGRPGRVYSRGQIMDLVWESPEHSLDRTVDTHIKTLRRKIRKVDPAMKLIRTHRGVGYSANPAKP